MTFEEAKRLVQDLMASMGQGSEGLNMKGLGGVEIGDAQLYFEYHSNRQALETSALIYKFRDAPKPGILDGFYAEEKAGTDTGGGAVDFEPENKGLFLSRFYTDLPSVPTFQADMQRLTDASLVWGKDVLDRVASKVFKR